mmetsp:Transcript_128618/g.274415  ORF Transcript_128618/g.274415 Transcript_128618/m.274415 type:complete len:365 (+) Transcript_128618:87-1181(+)
MVATEPKYGASAELPSTAELEQITKIRDESRKEIDALTCNADDITGDLRICRFLRARHGNAKEAGDWFRQFLRWRVSSGMDVDRQQVVGRSPEDFVAWFRKFKNPYLPFCPYAGRTSDGHVLMYMRQGRMDAQKFLEHRQLPLKEDAKIMDLVLEWTLWHLNSLSRQENRMAYVIKVLDFRGLGADGRKLPIFVPGFKDFMSEMLKSQQKNYCDHDALFVMLNTPFAFRAVFAVIKLLLTKRQVAKIRILGDASKADVRQQLADLIPEDRLPLDYGGSLEEAPGAFPLHSAAEIEAWYRNRHLLPMEIVESGDVAEAATTSLASADPPKATTTEGSSLSLSKKDFEDPVQQDVAIRPAGNYCCW